MKYRRLRRTDLEVSVICLGSMTWGEQNTETEGHEQLDMALDAGVNFIDTAEMYSFPARAETTGASERCIGSWLKRRQVRDRVVITTKVTGRDFWLPHIRGGETRLDRKNIEQAIDGSLQRLQTDGRHIVFEGLLEDDWEERYRESHLYAVDVATDPRIVVKEDVRTESRQDLVYW